MQFTLLFLIFVPLIEIYFMIKIFVTIGNDKHKFNRLIDTLVELDKTHEDLFFMIQYGHTQPKIKTDRYKDFISKEQFVNEIMDCFENLNHREFILKKFLLN